MSDDIYAELLKSSNMKIARDDSEYNGIDAYFTQKNLPDSFKISSLADLIGFSRIGDDTLVHKAKKDLWNIKETSNGDVIIERLFDPNTQEPLKI